MVLLRCCLGACVVLLAALGACSVGEVPIGGGGADAGVATVGTQAGFDAMIKPILMTKNCVSCHSAAQPPNFSSYAALDVKYKSSPLATNKLLTEAADGALHNGVPYLTTAEKTTVSNWIQNK